jgi:CubicO group peptidase (beta-lactamase class C family)
MDIAVQKGLLHGVNDSIAIYLPGLPKDAKEKITIKDLLNMRSGLDTNDKDPSTSGNEDNLDKSSDWIHTIYTVPMNGGPGLKYNYCSINSFWLSRSSQMQATCPWMSSRESICLIHWEVGTIRWRHVPINRITGQGNLSITTRDLATIGELMLNDGVAQTRIKRSLVTRRSISVRLHLVRGQ